jgi:TPR repeat protein
MQVKLGVFYQHGRGVAKDAFMAAEWYAEAEAEARADAQEHVSHMPLNRRS